MSENGANCRHTADAVAFALGNPCADPDFMAAHIDNCCECRQAVATLTRITSMIKTVPQAEPSPDLTARIMAALPPPKRQRLLTWPRVVTAAAAALALLLGGTIWLRTYSGSRIDPASNWLASTQLADGSWHPAESGGHAGAYAPALTALASLALERSSPANRRTVERAIKGLLSTQNSDGSFGPPGAARAYNHSMITASLLAIKQLRPNAVATMPLQQAIEVIRNTQQPVGAWGYDMSDEVNTALTVWHTDALQRAAALGWDDRDGHLRKAVRWLRTQQTSEGRFAYNATPGSATTTLDAMGYTILLKAPLPVEEHGELARQAHDTLLQTAANAQPDFYRDFFTVRALDAIGDTVQVASLRKHIASLQGDEGAWPTADRWSNLGGELYATTMAMLTLH